MRRSAGVVIGWMPTSQRSSTLADRLGYEVLLFGRAGFRRWWTAVFTYPYLAVLTAWSIVRLRPRAIVIVAPPFVAPMVVAPLAWATRARMSVDIHSGALLDRRWRWSIPVLAAVCRRASASVVTLPTLATRLRLLGVDALVIPDPLPRLPGGSTTRRPPRARPLVVAICGWGADEPIVELLAAAEGRSWDLAITGRPRSSPPLPPNVHLTGFLDDDAYADLIGSADVVVVLTKRDQTLLSGAWEALALGRPLVVSSTSALLATFGPEIAAAGEEPSSIAAAIETALDDPAAESRSIATAARFRSENDTALSVLQAILEGETG